jgi:hypothetical protein
LLQTYRPNECQPDVRKDKAGGDVWLARKHIRAIAQLIGQVSAVYFSSEINVMVQFLPILT